MSPFETLLLYAAGWLPMLIIAIANGTLRELSYGKHMSELSAHQLSSITAIIAFFIYIFFFIKTVPPDSDNQAFTAGGIWLAMTITFEFIFGRYVMDKPWRELISHYNLLKGRLWALVLVIIFISPYLIHRHLLPRIL